MVTVGRLETDDIASRMPGESLELLCRYRRDRLGPMTKASDAAELSTLRSQVEELTARIVIVAERYDDADTAIATELFAAERSLVAARRSLERTVSYLIL
jgi:hypothetical protein